MIDMEWLLRLPDELTDGAVSLRPYVKADSVAMFDSSGRGIWACTRITASGGTALGGAAGCSG